MSSCVESANQKNQFFVKGDLVGAADAFIVVVGWPLAGTEREKERERMVAGVVVVIPLWRLGILTLVG